MIITACPLCGHSNYSPCHQCGLYFKTSLISIDEEKARYGFHQNNSQDQGYLHHLQKLATPLKNFVQKTDHLLDFGCGPSPVLSSLMSPHVASADFFDPLFYPQKEHLRKYYDVITSTEVVEHFHHPLTEFESLNKWLTPNSGILAIMTQMKTAEINFDNWWYKNDPTHVVFYTDKTWEYLANIFSWKILYTNHQSLVFFQKLI